jgi:hypothetical protein
MNGKLPDLFTGMRGIGILRTSPFGDSPKLDFGFTEFSEVRLQVARKFRKKVKKRGMATQNSSGVHRPVLF